MEKRKSPSKITDGEKKWNKIFNALVKLSQNLQEERHILEDRVKYLNGVIYEMKMKKKVEFAKEELLLWMKEREAFNYKRKYDDAVDELDDFREWFNYLCERQSNSKDSSDSLNGCQEGQLQDEVRILRTEIEKCKSEKNAEISALLDEKNFVWNQFNKMEEDFNKKLRKKCTELQCANEKIQLLVDRAEELQFTNEQLRIDFAKRETDSIQKNEEISRLLKEISLLKTGSGFRTPSLRQCATGLGASHLGSKTTSIDGRHMTMKKESDPTNSSQKKSQTKPVARKSTGGKAPRKQLSSKERRISKGKEVGAKMNLDSAKLFTSSFKVPKLKLSSPQVV